MPQWIKYLLLVLILLLVASIPLAMQLETGSIQGKITDDRGPVANASVDARNVMSGATARAMTDASGVYKLENLRSGRYSLFVTAAGHDSLWVRQVVVEPGRSTSRDLQVNRARMTTTRWSGLQPATGA
ncbi:MAG TPA: carboxypeptidase-like regulatory domain-containing protein [Bryobacteraceae bacterium]|nr:carboxypeptidase-like regulatory domain-containing protein [Bryobacteraceae bacterium]